jgi:hypothetical protein
MKLVRAAVVSGALVSFAGPARAQVIPMPTATETNAPPIIPFLEGTDVFWTVQRGDGVEAVFPNKLEANLFPHLVVLQNFTNTLDLRYQEQERGDLDDVQEFAYAISGTPAVRIRMLRDVSAPVRTPSYMPRANVQGFWVRGLKDCGGQRRERPADCATLESALRNLPRVTVWEGHIMIGHHSNGQDGCLSVEQRRTDDGLGDCFPIVVPTAETINRRNGSFSTNYLRFGGNYSKNWLDQNLWSVHELSVLAEFEYHPRAWVDENMVDLYGRSRLNTGVSYSRRELGFCRKRFTAMTHVTWNPTVADGVPSLSSTSQVSCFMTPNGGWGLFVRLYSGQDYYNVGFLDGIARVHIGATFSQADFFRFRRRQ